MVSKVQKFVSEQRQAFADQVEKLRIQPVASARDAAVRSAQRIKGFKEYIRDIARSGVRLTAISQSTAQSLIELQAEIVTSALTEAAAQLERAARTESVGELVRDQAEVLRATRDRIVSDMRQAVGIFKTTGGDIRKVATQTYAKVSGKGSAAPGAKKTARRRKARSPARKKATRARRAAA